ncbi:DNA polymerase III subunit alpha [Pseudactinotalea terrae]|uniref:DNA polymerase III subunit alpha n=1 Tax=Pseudactinotalea terrae TaxID=1743262 RepID=UPI0012E30126|nr:DNA polymerase III subunit alpha [Pseudactinotalea terrae]
MTKTTRGFVHLHVHTEYSPLDGMAILDRLVDTAVADGQPAIACTDHGSLGAAWRLNKLAQAAGIKAIIGEEVYMAIGGRGPEEQRSIRVPADEDSGDAIDADKPTRGAHDEVRTKERGYEHLTVLAINQAGWRNLVTMHNLAQDTYSTKGRGKPQPLMDYTLLRQHAEGIIILTGCLGSAVLGSMSRAVAAEARAVAARQAGREDIAASELETAHRERQRSRNHLEAAKGAVGKDNVYVEVMDHNIAVERPAVLELVKLARELDLPLVATNDSHFVDEDHDHAHEAWLAVGTKAKLSDTDRFKFHGQGYHLRTEAQMRALFDGADWWQEACDNTVAIAERAEADVFGPTPMRLPSFDVRTNAPDFAAQFGPDLDDKTLSERYLKHLVGIGARERRGLAPTDRLPEEVNARLAWEFKVIKDLGIADYFLNVRDVIEWARSDRGLPTEKHPLGEPGKKKPIRVGPGRGSAAGSEVSYDLRIVGVAPIENGLLFERFLDPQRIGMPDIDVDFEQGRRQEVLSYLVRRWGSERVAQIGTYGIARTKAAINDAARVLNLSSLGDKLSTLVPTEGGTAASFERLADADDKSTEAFRAALHKGGEDAQRIVELAHIFENTIKTPGVHACGVLISDEPMESLVPLRKNRSKTAGPDAPMITEWTGPEVDAYGLLKLDVLGLRNLDVVSHTMTLVAEWYREQERTADAEAVEAYRGALDAIAQSGIPFEPDDLDPGAQDEATRKAFALLREGRTAGVFQMESDGMTALAQDSGPESLDDLSAIAALYRPGPMAEDMHNRWAARKRGTEPVDYSIFTTDPAEQAVIASVLDESMGILAFQEQAMRMGEVLAGFGPIEKNRLRKAISKKIQSEIDAIGELWMAGAVTEQHDEHGTLTKIAFRAATAQKVWDSIKGAAKYAFNKSHSTAYGFLAFVTAYLKANYPPEFAAAILAITKKNEEKRLATIASLREEGIELLPPDINLSGVDTRPEGGNVRLGLSEIKGVGANAAAIITERDANGPFASLHDLLVRVKAAPRGAVAADESDEESGTTEEPTTGGASLPVNVVESLIASGALDSMGPRLGQLMMARALRASHSEHDLTALVPDMEWGVLERAGRQRSRLGVITGEHPLRRFGPLLRDHVTKWGAPGRGVGAVNKVEAGSLVVIVGLLAGWTEKAYRGGRRANIVIEGTTMSVDGVMWDSDREALGFVPAVGSLVAARAQVRVKSVEVEHEDGSIEVVDRRELTFRDLEQIEVDDPRSGDIVHATEPLDIPAYRVAPAAPLVLQLNQGVSLSSDLVHRLQPGWVETLTTLLTIPEAPERMGAEPLVGVLGHRAVVLLSGQRSPASDEHLVETVRSYMGSVEPEQASWLDVDALTTRTELAVAA